MIRLDLLFFMQVGMGIIMIIMLQKISKMKKQVDDITKEVKEYVSFITEDIGEEEARDNFTENLQNSKQKIRSKKEQEEAQNRIIQAVLGEYFP